MRSTSARFAGTLVALLALAGLRAVAQDESDIDAVSVVRVGDEVVAIDTEHGTRRSADLRLGEAVLGADARGQIGVARTSERLLGFKVGGRWSQLDYSREERAQPPAQTHLARSAALVAFPRRLAAFTAAAGEWFQLPLAFDETFQTAYGSRRLLAAATSRRLIAVDPELAGFPEIALAGDERAQSSSSADRAISITTSRRVLSYRAGSGRWESLGEASR